MKRPVLGVIRFYQRTISPQLGNNCRFEPSCSEYGIQAIEKYGVLRGVPRTAWRIARCNPFSSGGYDPPYRDAHVATAGGPGPEARKPGATP